MEISIVEWKDVNQQKVAQLIYDIFAYAKTDWRKNNSPEKITGFLEEIEDDGSFFAATIYSEDRLVGFVALALQKSSVEMNPTWLGGDPFISPDLEREYLMEKLVFQIASWARDRGVETIAFYRSHFESATREYQRIPLERYQAIGFKVRENDYFMGFNLEDYESKSPDIPHGYNTIPIRDVDHEAVYACFYETFRTGQAPFFFDQTESEKRAYFETWFNQESLRSSATIILLYDDEIVGFSFARPYGTPGNYLIEWIGVHPDYRRRGLGTILMNNIASVAKQEGYETMSLSCATTNSSAYALYRKLGWYDDGGETLWVMKLENTC